MQRRSLIQTFFSWMLLAPSRLRAQAPLFPGSHEAALKELAASVLPESLGRSRTDTVALQFVRWVAEYNGRAEMQTGYGFTRIRYKPASPASRYLEQLDQLASTAFLQSDVASRRLKIGQALAAANVKELPFIPDGTHVASDLMAFYFQGSEANDLAYLARVGKDKCRGLKNSGDVPAAMKQDGVSAQV